MSKASDDCVPDEEILVLDLPENHESVAHVSGGRGAEGQDSAGGDFVFDEAGFDELRMELLEVRHGDATFL